VQVENWWYRPGSFEVDVKKSEHGMSSGRAAVEVVNVLHMVVARTAGCGLCRVDFVKNRTHRQELVCELGDKFLARKC
jgi:hypothetical protein